MATDAAFDCPHRRLDAYRVAVELAAVTKSAVDGIQRGHRGIADQALRAATSTVLLIAEGANRRTAAEKRHRYSLARGECGELAAAIELAVVYGFIEDGLARRILELAARVNAMLLKLEKRFGAPKGELAGREA